MLKFGSLHSKLLNVIPNFKSFIEEMEKSHPKFREALNVLFKQMRTISRHAGGVIISNDTKNNMPIIKAKVVFKLHGLKV